MVSYWYTTSSTDSYGTQYKNALRRFLDLFKLRMLKWMAWEMNRHMWDGGISDLFTSAQNTGARLLTNNAMYAYVNSRLITIFNSISKVRYPKTKTSCMHMSVGIWDSREEDRRPAFTCQSSEIELAYTHIHFCLLELIPRSPALLFIPPSTHLFLTVHVLLPPLFLPLLLCQWALETTFS